MDIWTVYRTASGKMLVKEYDAGRIDPEASACWLAPVAPHVILFFGELTEE